MLKGVFIVAFSLFPRERYASIYDINPQDLKARGISLLLLDLDNTVTPYGIGVPSQAFSAWISSLRAQGIVPFILSNSRKAARVPDFAAHLELPFLRHAGKPKRAGFLKAMTEMGYAPTQTAMVGDQIFTDILGANRSDVHSILVHPLRMDTIFRVLRFGIETPFRLAAPKREKA